MIRTEADASSERSPASSAAHAGSLIANQSGSLVRAPRCSRAIPSCTSAVAA